MAKIQVSTVKMNADVEVINVSSYLVAKCVRAQMVMDNLIDLSKQPKQEYHAETDTYGLVVDKDGNPVYEHQNDAVATMEEYIYPLLNELVEAFGVKDNRL